MTTRRVIAAYRQTDGSLAVDLPRAAEVAESRVPMLSIKGLSVRFGGIVALDNVSLEVNAGQICGLIGPNGAGKTTLFNCLSRLYHPCAGTIHFAGEQLLKLPRHRVARLGIGRTFQNLALFQTMSARDNVLVGGHCHSRGGFVANALRLPAVGCEERLLNQRISGLLQMLHLASIADLPVSVLPFWSRKRVELARALASGAVRPAPQHRQVDLLFLSDLDGCARHHRAQSAARTHRSGDDRDPRPSSGGSDDGRRHRALQIAPLWRECHVHRNCRGAGRGAIY
jgi:ABC-type uncharacterized transport system ATPase subunit